MSHPYDALLWIPLLPLLGAVFNGLVGRRVPRMWVAVVGVLAPVFSFLTAVSAFLALRDLGPEARLVHSAWTWMAVGGLEVPVHLTFDALSAVMVLVVTGVGALIHLYSVGYMEHDPGFARYFAYLNLFMFAMLVLVLGSSLPILFVGWEGVGLCSYLLIGFWHTDAAKAAAGMKAFVVNRIGDLGFLLGMFILFREFGTLSFAGLQGADLQGADSLLVTLACLFLFVGAAGKSAQIPLFVWLPDAMAGPTPVSALIHAATMVTAGVYLLARMSFLYVLSPTAMAVVALVGGATALFSATVGLTQHDIKKVLAYSTVSQLGFMFVAAGVGAFGVAIFHLTTHAFFKACLFLGSGSVIHAMEHALHGAGGHADPQDIRGMGGLGRAMPVTAATFGVSTLAIAGFPLTAGFFSKDEILWHAFSSGLAGGAGWQGAAPLVAYGMAAVAALFTAIYMGRVFLLTFSGACRSGDAVAGRLHESPATMTLPLVVLGALALVGGFLGVPHGFAEHTGLHVGNHLHDWLQPVLGAAQGAVGVRAGVAPSAEWGLTLAASAVGLAGLAAAWVLWAGARSGVPARVADALGGLYRLVRDRYRIDELYAALVVRPLVAASDLLLHKVVDRFLIDTVALGIPVLAVRGVGALARAVQTGDAQWYAGVIVLAVAGFLGLWSWGA